ncbi:unnamed protein product, partial [Darwinula stevensoni]
LLCLVKAAFVLVSVTEADVQSITFHLLKQGPKLWPLAGTGKNWVKTRNAVDCGSICHSLRPICNALNWHPGNFTCEFVKTPNVTLQDAPGAMVHVNSSSVCQTPPPPVENRTLSDATAASRRPCSPKSRIAARGIPVVHLLSPSRPMLRLQRLGNPESERHAALRGNRCASFPTPLAQGFRLFLEDGRFYKRYPGPMNRIAVSQVCCVDGARLASDTNVTVYSAIRSVAPNTTEAIVQGATDELVESTWIYEDPSFLKVNNTPITPYIW